MVFLQIFLLLKGADCRPVGWLAGHPAGLLVGQAASRGLAQGQAWGRGLCIPRCYFMYIVLMIILLKPSWIQSHKKAKKSVFGSELYLHTRLDSTLQR